MKYFIPCICEDCEHDWQVEFVKVNGKWEVVNIEDLECSKCGGGGDVDLDHLYSLMEE